MKINQQYTGLHVYLKHWPAHFLH